MEEVLSFARKYRPTDLQDGYIGNIKVKDTIQRYLRKERPRTILLYGNTGCGKTTIARLLVREYLCENRDPDGGSCGVCDMCQMVDEYIRSGNPGDLAEVEEVDITAQSGKGDIESILERAEIPSFTGGWRVFIFDECHMASPAAQNRMLKLVEEPPENVLLMFCTTDPQKMLETLKNRCQLKLKIMKPTTKELTGLLKGICLNEGKDYNMEGLRMISSRADNVIRDSLNYLETVLTTRGEATGQSVSDEFLEVTDKLIYDFYKAYLSRDLLGYMSIMYKIKTTYDFGMFLTSLVNYTVRGIYIMNNIDVEGLTPEEIMSYKNVFSAFSLEEMSWVLSSLKKMSIGDIEVNLMSFIYVNEETPKVEVVKESSKPVVASDVAEVNYRNSNLKKLEDAKMLKGAEAVKSLADNVDLEDGLSDLFCLEKVE